MITRNDAVDKAVSVLADAAHAFTLTDTDISRKRLILDEAALWVRVAELAAGDDDDRDVRVGDALDLIRRYGRTDGDHHKAWLLRQVTVNLTGGRDLGLPEGIAP